MNEHLSGHADWRLVVFHFDPSSQGLCAEPPPQLLPCHVAGGSIEYDNYHPVVPCPQGLKANMTRLYQLMTEAQFTHCSKPTKYKKLLFALCFFHSILLERKKFLQLGWNIIYGFNDSDFEVCANGEGGGSHMSALSSHTSCPMAPLWNVGCPEADVNPPLGESST